MKGNFTDSQFATLVEMFGENNVRVNKAGNITINPVFDNRPNTTYYVVYAYDDGYVVRRFITNMWKARMPYILFRDSNKTNGYGSALTFNAMIELFENYIINI